MKRRTLVIGDIHGAYRALEQVMQRAAVTEDDKLIFLGDYVDGWSQSPQVLDYLLELRRRQHCVFIRGNHDDLFYEHIKGGKENHMWLYHGGQATIDAYSDISETQKQNHIVFLETLVNYHLDKSNRLFVHAGFTNMHGIQHEYFPEMSFWDRTLWEMALALDPALDDNDPLYPRRLRHYAEIYIGHTPTTRIGKHVPVKAANVWNIDTGAAYKSPLTIMDVDSKQFWQSDNVNELYPGEKGRN